MPLLRKNNMKFARPLIPGRLIQRYKRFLADIELEDGTVITAHCANSGSMEGCKKTGSKVYVTPHDDPKRKLKFTWEIIRVGRTWVGINTGYPNRIVFEAIEKKKIPELTGYGEMKREVKYGKNSRIDVWLNGPDHTCYVEVKNVTLKDGNVALFPDAVTERGAKHLRELVDQVAAGDRAVMFYFVQRSDCEVFKPADDIDPVYGKLLREAVSKGVEVLVYEAKVTPTQIRLGGTLPYDLGK